jgi:aminopeptidase
MEFHEQLTRYADLLVRTGVDLRPGQTLVIRKAPVESAPAIRILVDAAYAAGAGHVEVFWNDTRLDRIRISEGSLEELEKEHTRVGQRCAEAAAAGAAFLAITGHDPRAFASVPQERLHAALKAENVSLAPFRRYIMNDTVNWLVAAVVTEGWAAAVFPDLPAEHACARLWETIFQLCRIDRPDPEAAWLQHRKAIQERREYLDRKAFTSLRYSSPGTRLEVGLPDGHIWHGVGAVTESGIPFIANMPTEEVFTLPHRDKTEGVVVGTRPFVVGGTTIEDFRFRFEKGRIVEASAARGEGFLRNLITEDDGASRLGEVALVPHSSPVSQSGLVFHNTLFDENASCHLALGRGYRFCLEDGQKLPDEEFALRGGNSSIIHEDFMIGSDQLDIDGVTRDGSRVALFREGEWVI